MLDLLYSINFYLKTFFIHIIYFEIFEVSFNYNMLINMITNMIKKNIKKDFKIFGK
jgi:hypothetical protein